MVSRHYSRCAECGSRSGSWSRSWIQDARQAGCYVVGVGGGLTVSGLLPQRPIWNASKELWAASKGSVGCLEESTLRLWTEGVQRLAGAG
jgi:hypothetical protein